MDYDSISCQICHKQGHLANHCIFRYTASRNNVAPPQKAFLGLNLNAGSTSNPSLGFSNEFDFNVQIPSDTANESGGYWSHGTSGPVWIPD